MQKLNIQSLRETIGKHFIKPPISKVTEYVEALSKTNKAIDYLKNERGFTDETIKHFQLGYSVEHNAISIPIFKKDELINIKYRFLDPKDIRYIGERGAETWIYNDIGIEEGRKKNAILIVEGEFDLMMCYQQGITNIISPASGKDSYGVWIEHLDTIPKVWVAYDNDTGGQETSKKLAERLGVEKCYEVQYPEGSKDANDYLKTHTKDEFRELLKEARPFYKYKFKNLSDIIDSMRKGEDNTLDIDVIPSVKVDKDWLIVVSGKYNVGKTSYVMNIANELMNKNIPTLVMPFERGIDNVGRRFMQVKFDKTMEDFKFLNTEEWEEVIEASVDNPLYFSVPKKNEIQDTIIKSKRLFNTQFVIIDHLDYVVRNTVGNKEAEIGATLQGLKRVAEEHSIVILIVTHIRKIDSAGAKVQSKPNIEDLKGSASLYQDPECVVLLHAENDQLQVSIAKNKGAMVNKTFAFNSATGKMTDGIDDFNG